MTEVNEDKQNTNNKKTTQIVYSAKLARYLLKLGYQITDIDDNKYTPGRTVFFFKNDTGLDAIISHYRKSPEILPY